MPLAAWVSGGTISYGELILLSPGSPPERPHPQPPDPTQPPDGIWGPLPGFPTNPIQLPPWAGKPQPPFPGQPPGETTRVVAVVSKLPEGVTPPAAPPADAKPMSVYFGPGTLPTIAWVAPNVSTGPVEPPAAPPA
jgi:hypothetical protein